ncbi:MAG: hypothetical protein U5O16_23495 [Rhodococcus sp. (in: high G+C Gram-positive bacteria)]|uniref:hypothetical protein n=1 Tax=Rhodococcus sp. TaxID=1831 RepID=UPI002ADB9D79|nr:hypothetical protein [Rhodococcus sp. (in: high G+C Gram-positive bacteria)]
MSKKTLPNPYPTVRKRKRSRTPEDFPKMKHRARGREHRNHIQRVMIGSAHIEITPEAPTPYLVRLQRLLNDNMRDRVSFVEGRFAAEPPPLQSGTAQASVESYALPEQFPARPADEYSIHAAPRHLPTAALNSNVRKRR